MINRARLHFFVVMATIVSVIIAVFCGIILLSTYSRNTEATASALEKMVSDFEQDRPFPSRPLVESFPDRFNNVRGFTVEVNSSFTITRIRIEGSLFSEEEIVQFVTSVVNTHKTKGNIGDLAFLVKEAYGNRIIAIIDMGIENALYNELFITVLLAGGGGTLVLLAIIWFLSYWVIKPVSAALDKQKRFISEAGHELKTPLTVISAGLELAQKSCDQDSRDQWNTTIKEQTERMSVMVSDLLSLSKIDENNVKVVKSKFDLSQTVMMSVLEFEGVAYENGKTFSYAVKEGILYKGDQNAVRQAIGILCDNAIKHSLPNDTITISLEKTLSKTTLGVSNSQNVVEKGELSLLFERFYRSSGSRSLTQGAGLGLSILHALAERQSWTLNVDIKEHNQKEIITFSIAF
ncbi:MAG: HAMP domain-containing histidine kinase [Dehalococcoidia bacterium]|nr:HAMP domain-containing histidine kinase [Dehalococcoidia bacterium]